jgi:hypothetical protein
MNKQEELDKKVREIRRLYEEYKSQMVKLREEVGLIIADIDKELKAKKVREVMAKIDKLNI